MIPMRCLLNCGLVVRRGLTVLMALATAQAAEPHFQYFRHDGGVADARSGPLPDRLDASGALCWRTPLDSGQSTPVVRAGKVFLTTYDGAKRELETVALDQKTGTRLWRRVVPAAKIETYHPQTGNPAPVTPACDGQHLYVFFGSFGLICYDLEGKQVWDYPMGPFQDEYGAGSSPVLIDDKIILNQDHDIDSFLMAIDRKTGRMVWKTARPAAVRSYATPVVWTQNGQKQLLVAGALELAAYDPANGEKLWWANGLARIVVPTPVLGSDMIYVASWTPGGDAGSRIALESWTQALAKWDKNGNGKLTEAEVTDREVLTRFFRMDLNQSGDLDQTEWERHAAVFRLAQNAILALKPAGRGDLTQSALVWKYQRGVPYVATPLLHSGMVWMVKDGGIVTRLDAATGRLLSEERLPGPGNYFASPVAGDGKVYFASEPGVVSIVAEQPEWRVISSHKFGEKISATPVIEGNRIYLRTEKALYCFQGTPMR